jgi:N-glycosylase/DNA lyase
MDFFLEHYKKIEPLARKRLNEFKDLKNSSHEKLLEELTFCVFAANSSAKMGILSTDLLKDVLHEGSLEDIQKAVHKKVRFYNVRSKYLHFNREFINENHGSLKELIKGIEDPLELRLYIKNNLKGFGMKESSHFLRNIGFSGFAIIDKHVLFVLEELGVRSKTPPKNALEYLEIEKQIIDFANSHGLDVDVLDLAFWSYRTGEIIK